MCGICGFVTKHKVSYEKLKEMNNTMVHRGPDDSGEEIECVTENIWIGLAQRRLSILDLSGLGHQPMQSADGSVSVVFNGEIYNYQELKSVLSGYPFRSHCDTEVILAAYLKWGIGCVKRFNGMFAFAVYDRRTKEVWLARDRIGKKPLYYYWHHGELVFGSELKPLMAYPYFEKKINSRVLSRFLYHQYIQAPETIFAHTYKLEPGAVLRYHNGCISTRKYWDVSRVYHKNRKMPVKDYRQARAELKALLTDAVKIRLEADVPVGMFLSGGYDSSLVTAIARRVSGQPVRTYAIGFEDPKLNEAGYAKAVAEALGTIHTEYYITEQDMLSLVDSIPQYYDEPFADASQIPSMLVAEAAGKDVKVVLTGDGGDELFCGYNIYDLVRLAQLLDPPGRLIEKICGMPLFQAAGLADRLPLSVKTIVKNKAADTKTQLISDIYLYLAETMVKGETEPVRYPSELHYAEPDWQKRRMLLDLDTYLPGDILCKVDRATMKYSLEARCPLLDYRVMEYSFCLNHAFKYKWLNKKRILKDLAYEYIPKKLLDRPKKGFGVPLDAWLRGPLREMLLDFSAQEYVARQGIFEAGMVRKLTDDFLKAGDGRGRNFSRMLWSYLCFQRWYQRYLS